MIKWRGVFALSRERVVECVSISLLVRGRVFGNYRSERRHKLYSVVDREGEAGGGGTGGGQNS